MVALIQGSRERSPQNQQQTTKIVKSRNQADVIGMLSLADNTLLSSIFFFKESRKIDIALFKKSYILDFVAHFFDIKNTLL